MNSRCQTRPFWCRRTTPDAPQPANSSYGKSRHRSRSRPGSLGEQSSTGFCLAAKIQRMKLQINGEPRDFNPPLTLAGLVEQLGMKADRVAVELNRSIVARDQWAKTGLADGDRLEIVHFVGGG